MAVNKQMEKTPMPEQEARVRAGNFEEVALGYTEEMALNEAARCLQLQASSLCVRLSGECGDPGFHRPDCGAGLRGSL